jgi:hypothetical protein
VPDLAIGLAPSIASGGRLGAAREFKGQPRGHTTFGGRYNFFRCGIIGGLVETVEFLLHYCQLRRLPEQRCL